MERLEARRNALQKEEQRFLWAKLRDAGVRLAAFRCFLLQRGVN